MINMTLLRDDDPGAAMRSTVPVSRAYSVLVDCELAFGAEIVEISPVKLVTSTPLFGHRDVSTFEGPEADMAPLVRTALVVLQVREANGEAIRQRTTEALHALCAGRAYPYLIAEGVVGHLIGGCGLREAALVGCGVTDPADVTRFAAMPLRDLTTALGMAFDEGLPPAEVLAVFA